jgi:glycosyltransferase involved in cell wall biosynthesis
MNAYNPVVSVVTPVYNGEKFLGECIESIIDQTYGNFEYIIASNCSTDGTLEIAKRYEKIDQRIRVVDFEEFVGIIHSHNRALRLISTQSKYCKIVSADDLLFPECIAKMVQLAEENPSVGIVGAYHLCGDEKECHVGLDGLPYHTTIVPGKDACRWHLLGGRQYFGDPSSTLFRSDVIRNSEEFFPNSRENADISAFYKYLRNADFGFVHQVLSYMRVHEDALSAEARKISIYSGSHLLDVCDYGPVYLTKDELEHRLKKVMRDYYRLLARGVISFKGRKFWKYHREILIQYGAPFYGRRLATAICVELISSVLNLQETIAKIFRRL